MAPPLTLVCLLEDEHVDFPYRTFVIKIEKDQLVDEFKRDIRNVRVDLPKDLSYAQLTCWKLNQSIRIIPESQGMVSNIFSDLPKYATSLVPSDKLSDSFFEPPPEKHLHIVIQVVTRKRKREGPVDVSKQLLEKWNVPLPTIPSLIDLAVYLDAPLEPTEKIPITNQEWRQLLLEDPGLPQHTCYPEDLGFLFTENEDEKAILVLYSMYEAIVRTPPEASGTEDSFHAFWDRNILDILVKCLQGPKWIRKSNQGTDTGSSRPDLGLLLNSTCIFRGEEEGPIFTGKHPLQSLVDKTQWAYDPAPYMLGYCAVGPNMTIVAIHPKDNGQGVLVTEIVSEDLSKRQGRIKNAARMIRLVKVLRAIESVVGKGLDADMFPVTLDNGKVIEFLKTKIRKTYPPEDAARVSFLGHIYRHLKEKGVPNVDQITKLDISSGGCFVELEPRGDANGPRSADDVTNALICILEALKVLHTYEPRIFHRDIRWANVMRSTTDPNRWFLIDWEDAAIAPTKAAPKLRPETHAPQVFQDGHGAEVDIWGVGKLVATATIPNLPRDLVSLGQKMVDGSVVSAEQGLEELKLL